MILMFNSQVLRNPFMEILALILHELQGGQVKFAKIDLLKYKIILKV